MCPLLSQRETLNGQRLDQSELSRRHFDESKALLLEAFKGPNESSGQRIRDCLATWPGRADKILEFLARETTIGN